MSSPSNNGQAVHPFRQRYQLKDVWNAAASERDFDYTFWLHVTLDILVESGMRYFGYILVVLAGSIIAFLGLGGLFHVLPKVAKVYSLSFLVQNIFGCMIVFNISYNFILAASTRAGSPRDFKESLQYCTSSCKKCNFYKPDRCHHCSICNQCVMRMDHHCPWLSNCIGLRNYRYFYGFLFWVVIGTGYLFLITSPLAFGLDDGNYEGLLTMCFRWLTGTSHRVIEGERLMSLVNQSMQMMVKSHDLDVLEERIISTDPIQQTRLLTAATIRLAMQRSDWWKMSPALAMFLFDDQFAFLVYSVLSLGVCIGVSVLLVLHSYLIYTGQTTIECMTGAAQKNSNNNVRNPKLPYDRGLSYNIERLFGTKSLVIALCFPFIRRPVPVDEIADIIHRPDAASRV